MLVTGGFNYDLLKYKVNSIISEFLGTMYSNFIQPTILEFKRITTKNGPRLMDNFLTNLYDKNIDSRNLQDKISDHLPNFIII